MGKMTLLPGEKLIISSDNDILMLTSKRVRYDSTVFGSSQFISITLDSVASCGLITKSFPVLILLAFASLIGAVVGGGNSRGILLLVAVVLGIAYFVTRRAVISIASNGGDTILAPAKGMGRGSITEFLDSIEKQKLEFMQKNA